ncbi:hypothetical protein [Streptacidiphilus monticola]|uniref:DUF2269 family protein n=1 Tax=Streptacidiphilus monticola TaxID=2161674 RepID=A0ABW1FW89_9ACTN
MTKLFLVLHILAVIVAIGPVAVAASMFPPVARRRLAEPGPGAAEAGAQLRLLHRICQVYALAAVAVPVLGMGVAGMMKVTGDTWVVVSIVLTIIAAVVLGALVLPRQGALLAESDPAPAEGGAGAGVGVVKRTKQLAMYTGIFNLLWAAVTIIMIVRPGSSLNH